MKKLTTLILTFCTLFILAACDASTANNIQVASQGINDETSSAVDDGISQPNESSPAAHKHKFSAATCISPSKCSCGLIKQAALGHDCYDATCTLPKKCKRCGITKGAALGHDYSFATCTTPKKCKRCGVIESEKLGHTRIVGRCDRCEEFFAPQIILPSTPLKSEFVSDSQVQINKIDSEIDEKGNLIITFSGEKIWGTGTDVSFKYSLVDAEGIILVAGKWSEDGHATGDIFKDKQIIISNLGASKQYRFEILSSN